MSVLLSKPSRMIEARSFERFFSPSYHDLSGSRSSFGRLAGFMVFMCGVCYPALGRGASWIPRAGGDWQNSLNWADSVPQNPGDVATFPRTINVANSQINIQQPIALGHVVFANGATLSVNGQPIRFDDLDGSASISTRDGTRAVVIAAPIDVADELSVNLANGTFLTLGSSLPNTLDKTLEKRGKGVLLFAGNEAGWKGTVHLLDGELGTNATATLGRVVVDGGVLSGKGTLFVTDPVELRTGNIQFDFDNPTGLMGGGEVIKRGTTQATITSLGNGSNRSVRVDDGILFAANSTSIGTSNVPTRVASQYAVLNLGQSTTSPLQLQQSSGYANNGGLMLQGTIQSTLDLGGGRSIVNPYSLAHVRKISNGALTINGDRLTLTTDEHDYQGATEIGVPNMTMSHLVLRQNGALRSTSEVILSQFSLLRLDNALGLDAMDRSDRLGDTIPIRFNGGTLEYRAAENLENGQVSTERLGDLLVQHGLSRLNAIGNARLFAHSLRRTGAGLFSTNAGLNVQSGQGTPLFLDEAPVLENGMIGGWALSGSDFATYNPTYGLVPLYSTVTKVEQFAQATATSHVKFFGEAAPFTTSRTIASLVSGFGGSELRLGGHQLNIVSGGWINLGPVTVRNGQLTAGGTVGNRELFLHQNDQDFGPMAIEAAIVDNSGGSVGLTLSGRIVLSGANTYTGPTRVLSDTTRITAAQAIPVGTDLELAGGWYMLDFPATKPILLGDVSLLERSWFLSNDSLTQRPKVNATKYDLSAGWMSVDLEGAGPMRKTTIGRTDLSGDNRAYSGTIDVLDGTLFAGNPRALGTGTTTVYPGGMLVNAALGPGATINLLHGDIDLRGGELGVAAISSPTEWRFEGRLNLLANSTLSLYDAREGRPLGANVVMSIRSATTVADQVSTRLIGTGTFSFEGDLTIGEEAILQTSESNVRIAGKLIPASSTGTLVVDGGSLDWRGSVDVPTNRTLAVRRGEELLPLRFDRAESSIHGGGKLLNAAVVESAGKLSPGDSIGTLQIAGAVTLGSGAQIEWDLGNAAGEPGVGWDAFSTEQTLTFTASADAPMYWVIDASMTSGFDPQQEYRWKVATAASIQGFDRDAIEIDTESLRQRFPIPASARFRLSQVAQQLELVYSIREAIGDFDSSGTFDVADLDLLAEQMLAPNPTDLRFDLTSDGRVNSADREFWVHQIRNTYFGDTNLDGQFSATDLILVFQAGQYEDHLVGNSTWATGDWNGDREFSSGDLVTAFQDGGFEAGPRTPAAAVPEPAAGALLWMVLGLLASARTTREYFCRRTLLLMAVFGTLFGHALPVLAQESTWTGTSGGLWNASQNWSSGVANGPGRVARFNTQPQSGLILLDAPVTLEQLIFQLPRPLALSGDVPITFDSTSAQTPRIVVSEGAGLLSISAALTTAPAESLLLDTAASTSLELKGALSATNFGLTKIGAGTVTLSGANSGWNGTLLINEGTVEVASNSALGTASGLTTVGTLGTLLLSGNRDLSTESIRLNGGVLASNASATAIVGGPLVVDTDSEVAHRNAQGTLQLTGTVSGAGRLTLTEGTLEWRATSQMTGPIHVENGRLIVAKTLPTPLFIDGGSVDMVAAGATSGPLYLNGGLAQLFSTASTYSGRVFLKSGEFKLRPSQSSVIDAVTVEAANTAQLTVSSGGVLTVQGGVEGQGGLSVLNDGALTFSNKPLTFAGDVTLQGVGTTAFSSPLNIGGKVQLKNGAITLSSSGVAPIAMSSNTTLTVENGSKTYAGAIDIQGTTTVASGFGGRLSGPIQLENAEALFRNNRNGMTIEGPIAGTGNVRFLAQGNGSHFQASGGINVTGNVLLESSASDNVSTFGASTIRGNLRILEAPVTFTGPLDLTGNLILDSNRFLTLSASGNHIRGSVETNQTTFLTVNGETTFESLQLKNGTRLEGMGRIHVNGSLTAGYSEINLTGEGIVGPTEIRVQGVGPLRIGGLGTAFTGNVLLNEGLLTMTNSNAIGQGAVTFTGPNASIDASGTIIGGTLHLQNAQGYRGVGALASGQFNGDIHLGDTSSNLAGSGLVTISGRLHGGGMNVLKPSVGSGGSFVQLTDGGHTLTGEIHIYGNSVRTGSLSLQPNAKLETPSKIVIEPFGQLELRTATDTPGVPNQLADSIPVVMRGGRLSLSNPAPIGERLGSIALESGSNSIVLESSATTYTLQSLTLAPMAALSIYGNVLPTEQFAFSNSLRVEDRVTQGFMGGAITIRDSSVGFLSFARYDSQRGILPLAPEDYTQGGPASWNATSHVLLSENAVLPSDRDIQSLAMITGGNGIPTLDLNGHQLNIRAGGFAQSGYSIVSNGRLTAGGTTDDAVMMFHVGNDRAQIAASIVDNPGLDGLYDADIVGIHNADNGRVSLVKSGEGMLALQAENRYSGDTWIHSGVLLVEGAGTIPSKSNVYVGSLLLIDGDQPLRPQSIVVRGGTVTGNRPIVETPLLVLESGEWTAELRGNGEVVKKTDSVMDLSLPLSFSGKTRIEEGTLFARGSFGSGVTLVGPAGTLTGTANGRIELHGGTLRNTVRIGDPSESIKGGLRVVASSLITADADAGATTVTIDSDVVVDAGMTLTKTGRSDLTFNRSISLGEDAAIRIESGGSQLGYFDSNITFGRNGTIYVKSGLSYMIGTLVPADADSHLHLAGDGIFLTDFSVDLKSGNRLSLDQNGTALPIAIGGTGRFMRGSGIVAADVYLEDRAVLRPGTGTGTLSVEGNVTIEPTSVLSWEMQNAAGQAGASGAWDLLAVTKKLNFNNGRTNGYRLDVAGVDLAGNAGGVQNFDQSRSQSWVLATAEEITGFNASHFSLRTTGFDTKHPLPRGARFHISMDSNQILLNYDVLLGDFNSDRIRDARDFDRMANLVRVSSTDLTYDVNFDNVLDIQDQTYWVEEILGTWFGDANLDGVFDSTDLVTVFQAGKYEDSVLLNAGWGTGDWNGDSEFNSSDLVIAFQSGGYDQGKRDATAAVQVPEPTLSTWVIVIGALLAKSIRRQRSGRSSQSA